MCEIGLASVLCKRTTLHACTDISQSSLTLWKNALQIQERDFEAMTYHPTLYYIRLQSHKAL